MGKSIEELKIVTCHIGSGSSISAVKYGKAVDTSMGFTPQEGLPMGTRCGTIDPSIIEYICSNSGMSVKEVNDALNKKSGLLGVSGVSNDARYVWDAAEEGNHRARLALDVLAHSAKKIIGSYAAVMNGVDVIVFTAGMGENDSRIRECIATDMEYLGVEFDIDANKNFTRGVPCEISKAGSRTKVLVIPTDEEYMIAKDTEALVK